MDTCSVAVLVDGDNISPASANEVLDIAKECGTIRFRRAYVDGGHLAGWEKAESFRLMFSATGKNSSDILLVLDAMKIVYESDVSIFVLATKDSDFRHLAHRLVEMGKTVIGVGPRLADRRFRAACSNFQELELVQVKAMNDSMIRAEPTPTQLDKRIQTVIKEISPTNGGVLKSDLIRAYQKKHKGFQVTSTGANSWSKYLSARPSQYKLDPKNGSDSKVWLIEN